MPAIIPEAQAYSDALMHVRDVALELKSAVLAAENARVALQTFLMNDGNTKIMAMDSGDIEEMAYELVGSYGKARKMHSLANALGRRLNVAMPVNPAYDPEYAALYEGSVTVKLSAPARR
jgi:hypothetical protein